MSEVSMARSASGAYLWNWLDSVVSQEESFSSNDSSEDLHTLDMLAFNAHADFVDLNLALDPGRTQTLLPRVQYTILAPQEIADLKCLSRILQKMRQSAVRKQWNSVSGDDRQIIHGVILNPMKKAGWHGLIAYVFEMIGTFNEHECNFRRRYLSIIARHTEQAQVQIKPLRLENVWRKKRVPSGPTREERLKQAFRGVLLTAHNLVESLLRGSVFYGGSHQPRGT
ncbi:hypothetical protein BU23DRAFT_561985 [Bimuria novae-zelandiae CBS 107.79]|uniref:Uncharacterized protein n=1 Tax=Bimuria novae-zelandiae CBS 107.79 TaxID=1447943 RepID=A0A6A5UTE7_9PLEO|nr:hypothetical protein BU23DRAFT_561985 [Bimuria novae-zelandiae CBS 107.79]